MILTCNSCGKKFVVPDSAITSSGRMVQCGSCGNKWRQFPTGEKNKSTDRYLYENSFKKGDQKIRQKPKKIKKDTIKKNQEKSVCILQNI